MRCFLLKEKKNMKKYTGKFFLQEKKNWKKKQANFVCFFFIRRITAFPLCYFFVEVKNNGKPLKDPKVRRVALDYQKLKKRTRCHNYPKHCIEDPLHGVNAHKKRTTLYLNSGYYQIPIREQNIPKTVFVEPSGCYAFRQLSLGLSSAPGTFQKLRDMVLRPMLNNCALVYLDDIIITSRSIEEHIEHITQVFTFLQQAALTVKLLRS